MEKHWIARAKYLLQLSREPLPYELNELDWKTDISSKERTAEHLIAFANQAGGGYLVFGINDGDAKLVGINQAQMSEIIGKLTNLGRDAIEPALIIDHATIEVNDVNLLFVHIPEQAHKPAHRRGKSVEEAWVRSGGTTRKASRQEIGHLLMNSKPMCWEELQASPLLEADQVLKQLDITTIALLRQRPLPDDQNAIMEWLIEEKIIIRQSSGYYITHFGAIAAAKDLKIFDSLARKRVRIIRYRGTNKVETINEWVAESGYAVAFESMIAYLKQVLPHSEIIQQALRQEVTIYPEIALRELLANALIHQDFSVTGASPMIEIYADRIEFTNPGTLLPSKRLDRLIGTTPESRNESLASSFRLYRICEERGTGFQKVVSTVELFGLPPVLFTPLENAFRVTLYAPRKFADMSQMERLEACYQHAVLQYLSSKTLTNTSLRERLKLHEKQRNQVTNLISDAVTNGRIKRKDATSSNKFAEYLPYWV